MARINNVIALVVFLIILCAVLAVCLLYKSGVDIIKQPRHYPNKTILFDQYSFKDDKLVYLVCDKDALSNCKVVQEKYPYKSPLRSCNVSLPVDGALYDFSILVAAFGTNNTFLLWADHRAGHKVRVRMSILDLNYCNMTEYLESDSFDSRELRTIKKILPYEHTIDVFYKNATTCGDNECTLAISNWDNKGNIFHRVNFSMTNLGSHIHDIYPIGNDVPNKGIVYLRSIYGYSNPKKDLWINYNNGTDERLRELFFSYTDISVVQGSVGACTRKDLNSNITCWQYDGFSGKQTLNVTLDNVNNRTYLHNMYTLPEGGFLLSFVEVEKCEEKQCDQAVLGNYFILKVDSAGKQVGKLRFSGLDKDTKGIEHAHIYKRPKKEEYCEVVVPKRKQSDKFEILANCFPISEFVA